MTHSELLDKLREFNFQMYFEFYEFRCEGLYITIDHNGSGYYYLNIDGDGGPVGSKPIDVYNIVKKNIRSVKINKITNGLC